MSTKRNLAMAVLAAISIGAVSIIAVHWWPIVASELFAEVFGQIGTRGPNTCLGCGKT